MHPLRLIAAAFAAMILTGCNEDVDTGLYTSPGGHSFAFLPLPAAKSVAVQVVWPMPWALNEANNPALPHLAVKMMLFGGADGMPGQSLQTKMAALGAEAYLLEFGVTLRTAIDAPVAGLDQAMTLTNALLRAPTLPADLLDDVIEAAATSRAEVYTRPTEQAFLALRMAVMKDQPNFSESMSFADIGVIRSVTLADIQRWHIETVVSPGALIAVAGPIDIAAAGQAVDLLMAGLPDTAAATTAVKPMDLGPRRILLHEPAAQTTTLVVIAPMPRTGDAGEMDDTIASYLLGGDDQALLGKTISARLGAPVTFTAAIDAFSRENRMLVMSGQISTDKTAAVLQAVIDAYGQMARQAPTDAELGRWTGQLGANLSSVKNNPANRANAMLESLMDGNNPMAVLDLDAMLARVTPATVQQRFAAAYPPAADLIYVAISSDAAALPGACVITQPKDVFACR